MNTFNLRRQALLDALKSRVLVLDGAMGTMLQRHHLTAEDFGGPHWEGCNERLVVSRPDVIAGIHRAYFQAGADIVESNSFGSNRIVLADYGLADQARELSREAARLARGVADEFESPARPRFVAGAMGPTNKAITVTGGVTFEQLRDAYYEQAAGLMEGGADFLLIETCQDTRNVKAGVLGVARLRRETGLDIPLMVSCTIEPTGTMLAGQSAEAFWVSLAHAGLLAVGLNCATGPEFMTDHIRGLHEISHAHISCYPNAGLPDEDGCYGETPETLAAQLERFISHGWLNFVGGCCGTTPEHIAAIAATVQGRKPRQARQPSGRTYYSGIDLVEADPTSRPLLVGERTNVIGSRLFKNLIAEGKWEEASEIARRQVRNGAHIIDVCLQSSERDEIADVSTFYERLIRKIKAPVMIDTTDPQAVELALTYCQGKSIINSINLEDGEEKFRQVCPLVTAYGAAVVVGCIDEDPEQAQAFTRERKLAVARRSVELLTGEYGIPLEDIIIDPLVFPCATGDAAYIGGAVETIEAVRLIKDSLPGVKTLLGISNVSFGLPAAARETLNSVFLYHCTKAGLDLAIVNTEKLERFASLPETDRLLSENLLFNTPPAGVPAGHAEETLLRNAPEDWRQQTPEQRLAINRFHVAAMAEHFRQSVRKQTVVRADIPLDERLAACIIEGTREGLIEDLNLKLAEGSTALEIINGPLMKGMDEVGRLFNNNELIVAEVLQSAEAMKAAVAHLEQFMEKSQTAARGKIVLATVKGDVHDIGKNLVDIILSNNGYQVFDLGIKVPPEEIIRACQQHEPDAVGLSGLLVKSALQMVATAEDLRDAGITVPLLVGGAALTEKFTVSRIAPAYSAPTYYAKDAMTGLRLLNQTLGSGVVQVLSRTTPVQIESRPSDHAAMGAFQTATRSSRVRLDVPPAPAPYWDRKTLRIFDLEEIWSYVNPQMLYGRHLGFRGHFTKLLAARDPQALTLHEQVEEVKRVAASFMKVQAVWQFFEAEAEGLSLRVYRPGESRPLADFHFQRQPRPDGLCLSDFILPRQEAGRDNIAMFVVTAGEGIREKSAAAKEAGEYFLAHCLQALALETAEACAEWLHRRLREDWGFPDPPELTMQERFTSRYRGRRYSFGYPACPELDQQAVLWDLLQPEQIGVELTEGMMMDPEASVSALVFHHPDCVYFAVETGSQGEPASGAQQP